MNKKLSIIVVVLGLLIPSILSASGLDTKISLDFKDTDIREIVKIVAEKAGLNIFVEKAVRGNVTIRARNMPINEFLDTLLISNGFAWEQRNNAILIADEKKLTAWQPVVCATHLSYISPSDAAKIIAQTIKKDIKIATDPERGLLLIGGSKNALRLAKSACEMIDLPLPQIKGNLQILRGKKVVKSIRFVSEIGQITKISEGWRGDEVGKTSNVEYGLDFELTPVRLFEHGDSILSDCIVSLWTSNRESRHEVATSVRARSGKAINVAEFEGMGELSLRLTLNFEVKDNFR